MKIMSLNVNNFGGLHSKKPQWNKFPLKADYYVACREFRDIQNMTVPAIMDAIKEKKPDAIIFQEYDVNASAGRKTTELLVESGYQPIYPDKEKEISGNYSITMMFLKNEYIAEQAHSYFSKAWKWCGIEIGDLRIVGIHVPDGEQFLNEIKEYAQKCADKKLIILGDFNIATNEWRAREVERDSKISEADRKDFFNRRKWILRDMPAIGYFDAVEQNTPTFFPKGTTVDHVLVSPSLKEKVSVQIPRNDPELSDHAVIIVDVDL